MKKFIATFILVVIVSGMVFFPNPAQASFNSLFFQSACTKPVSYAVGTVDSQFKVSSAEFKEDIDKAALIWNKAYGKTLFSYDPNAALKVNLIYDERQASFSQTRQQSDQVKKLGNQVDQLNNQLSQSKDAILPQIQAYQQELQDFNAKIQKLNQDIEYWNQKGGAPKDQYDQLNQQRVELQKEADSLSQKANQLDNLKSQYNSQVNQYNSQIGQLNQKANLLNQSIGSLQETLQQKPEEGIYDPNVPKIDIYFDISEPELIETIAHELGHARGLDHNQNPHSIMYPFTNKVGAPSADDLKDLQQICRTKSLPEIFFERMKIVLNFYSQLIQQHLSQKTNN